tara:strand:+ start:70 stop:174 length:105 start_codon:yes stop_codon:yes gene_type:complete
MIHPSEDVRNFGKQHKQKMHPARVLAENWRQWIV